MTIDGKVLVEGVADLPRPDVGRVLGTDGEHGFRFGALALSPKDVSRVAIQARPGPEHDWQPVKKSTGKKRAVQYQTFDDAKGASKSAEKLKALQLGQLRNRHSEATPLKGLSVLDLGCNEGFFCGEALRQGAPPGGRHRPERPVPRARQEALPRGQLHPRLVVGRAERAVRRDPVPVGDPLRAAAARAAGEARHPPDADRDADPRMRDDQQPHQGLAHRAAGRRRAALPDLCDAPGPSS